MTLKHEPIAGEIPHTPVNPQYPPMACLLVRFIASIICLFVTFIVPSFLSAVIKAPDAIQAFSQPSMGMLSWLIRYSVISKGFFDLLAKTYSLTVSKRPFP
jgi:hypothetical protein